MPAKQLWKDWKSEGPAKLGVFEKQIWHTGAESDESSVPPHHCPTPPSGAASPQEPADSYVDWPQMVLADCRGCGDWSLDDLITEVSLSLVVPSPAAGLPCCDADTVFALSG
jgi:hypothetical protein